MNKTSALENCCTSAIGRALSACGLSGGEYASSFEVDNAINNKPSAPTPKPEPKAKGQSSEKPKKNKHLHQNMDELGVVKKLLEEAMYIHPAWQNLGISWNVNKKNLDQMQEEEPEMYADVLKKVSNTC